MDFVLLIAGILGLWGGTELTVWNAIKLARNFNVSELFIGLTILAFGTDLPELVVAIDGAIHNFQGTDTSDVISGNVIGSSISQISIVIGATAIFHVLSIGKVEMKYLAIESIGSIVLLTLVAFDNVITWNDGAILIIAFLIYFLAHLQREKRAQRKSKQEKQKQETPAIALSLILLIVGLGIVTFSSDLTINHALLIAQDWGIQQSFIGAIIIGFGTSLPELAISLNAVTKKKTHLSVGNVIGSNIFDLLIPIGAGSLIANININDHFLWFDLPILFVISIIVLYFLYRQRGLQKWEGLGLITIYFAYAIGKYFIN